MPEDGSAGDELATCALVATRASLVELVFQGHDDHPRRRLAAATALAAGVYGLLAIVAFARRPSLGSGNPELAVQRHARPAHQQVIEMLPPPSSPSPSPPGAPSPSLSAIRTAGRAVRRARSVAPAKAASVIARVALDSPLDLTTTTFTSGEAANFPGGLTAASARSSAPVAGAVALDAPAARSETIATAPLRTRPVALVDGTWSCPWPAEADAEQIDEQTVLIRVRVRADGGVEGSEVLSEPGHGFGRAATTCARRTRFQSARNESGAAITAWSPPIRVHFSR